MNGSHVLLQAKVHLVAWIVKVSLKSPLPEKCKNHVRQLENKRKAWLYCWPLFSWASQTDILTVCAKFPVVWQEGKLQRKINISTVNSIWLSFSICVTLKLLKWTMLQMRSDAKLKLTSKTKFFFFLLIKRNLWNLNI